MVGMIERASVAINLQYIVAISTATSKRNVYSHSRRRIDCRRFRNYFGPTLIHSFDEMF